MRERARETTEVLQDILLECVRLRLCAVNYDIILLLETNFAHFKLKVGYDPDLDMAFFFKKKYKNTFTPS